MSVLTDMADLLVAAGMGTKGVDIFVGEMPSVPDSCVSVAGYQGLPGEYIHSQAGPAYESPSIQITLRGFGLLAQEARAQTAYEYLASRANVVVNSRFYLALRPNHTPFLMRRDDNNRDLWVINLQAMYRS